MEGEIEEAGAPEDQDELAIVRDGPLPRYSADTAVSTFLGRDVEIAFLAYTSRLEAEVVGAGDGAGAIRLSSELLEVARVRIAPVGIQQMVLNMLQQLLASGAIEPEQLEPELGRMLAPFKNRGKTF